MKRIISALLSLIMVLCALAACTVENQNPDNTAATTAGDDINSEVPSDEVTNDSTKPTEPDEPKKPVLPNLPETELNVNLSAFGNGIHIYKAIDFGENGAGTISRVDDGNWELITKEDGSKALSVQRVPKEPQYQNGKWTFSETQNWSNGTGILFYVDFSSANTDNFHAATIKLYIDVNGVPMIFQTEKELTAYSSVDGKTWVERHTKDNDKKEMHVAVDKKFAGYIYIPFTQYEGLTGIDALTAVEFDTCRITSGTAYINSVFLVALETEFDTPDFSIGEAPGNSGDENTEPTKPDEPEKPVLPTLPEAELNVDLSSFGNGSHIYNAIDFGENGAGTISRAADGDWELITKEDGSKVLSVKRTTDKTVAPGTQYQSGKWTFTESQNWSNGAGILFYVDFSSANTDNYHAATIKLYIDVNGDTKIFKTGENLTAYSSVDGKTWVECHTKSNDRDKMHVAVDKKFAGYIYIPFTQFEGLTEIDALTAVEFDTCRITSGTAYINSVYVVAFEGGEASDNSGDIVK